MKCLSIFRSQNAQCANDNQPGGIRENSICCQTAKLLPGLKIAFPNEPTEIASVPKETLRPQAIFSKRTKAFHGEQATGLVTIAGCKKERCLKRRAG